MFTYVALSTSTEYSRQFRISIKQRHFINDRKGTQEFDDLYRAQCISKCTIYPNGTYMVKYASYKS